MSPKAFQARKALQERAGRSEAAEVDEPAFRVTAGITPSDEQTRAIRAIVSWYRDDRSRQEFLLDGQAGTGKSTTAGFAVNTIRTLRGGGARKIVSGAYTAKAAKVMRDKGIRGAMTIHRMIYSPLEDLDGRPRWQLDPNGPASKADLIVIDEVSMVSNEIAADLRSFGKKILVLGDVDGQLPPVEGAGAFTTREPDFRLLEINRFALNSPIIRLAARARSDRFIPFGKVDDCLVAPLADTGWEHLYRQDTQVICGVHRTRWKANQLIRARRGFSGTFPQNGEQLICCKNNYKLALFNGSFGIARSDAILVDWDNLQLDIEMEDHDTVDEELAVHPHLFQQHFTKSKDKPKLSPWENEFDFGYAITCHKAQGSEWPHVTIIDDGHAFRDRDVRRRWLYTAITRASNGITILLRRKS